MPAKRILIVHDNTLVRHLIRAHLESPPVFTVCEEAADGVEAIVKAEKSRLDLIILDLVLARMNGLQVAAALKGGLKKLPVILFTLYKDVVPERELRFLGISAVVSKTSPIQALLDEVQKLAPSARSASA